MHAKRGTHNETAIIVIVVVLSALLVLLFVVFRIKKRRKGQVVQRVSMNSDALGQTHLDEADLFPRSGLLCRGLPSILIELAAVDEGHDPTIPMPIFVPNGGTIELSQPIRIELPSSCPHARILVYKEPYNRHKARTYSGVFTLKAGVTTLRAFIFSDDWQFGRPTPPVRFSVIASAIVGLDPHLGHLRPRDVAKLPPPVQFESSLTSPESANYDGDADITSSSGSHIIHAKVKSFQLAPIRGQLVASSPETHNDDARHSDSRDENAMSAAGSEKRTGLSVSRAHDMAMRVAPLSPLARSARNAEAQHGSHSAWAEPQPFWLTESSA